MKNQHRNNQFSISGVYMPGKSTSHIQIIPLKKLPFVFQFPILSTISVNKPFIHHPSGETDKN